MTDEKTGEVDEPGREMTQQPGGGAGRRESKLRAAMLLAMTVALLGEDAFDDFVRMPGADGSKP